MSDKIHQKKSKWAEVTCAIHGKPMSGNAWKTNQVNVSIPKSKREQQREGCPECAKEIASLNPLARIKLNL